MNLFKETGVGTFKPTPLASAYVSGSPFAQGAVHMSVTLVLLL